MGLLTTGAAGQSPEEKIAFALKQIKRLGTVSIIKENPARLLGLPPPASSRPTARFGPIDGPVTSVEARFPVK